MSRNRVEDFCFGSLSVISIWSTYSTQTLNDHKWTILYRSSYIKRCTLFLQAKSKKNTLQWGGGGVLVVDDLTMQFLKRRSNNFAWRTKTDSYRLQRHPGDVIWTNNLTVIKKCQHFSKLTCLSRSSVVETLEYSPDEVEENLPIWKSQIKKIQLQSHYIH